MSSSTPAVTLVGALVSASAYEQPLPQSAHEPIPIQAVASIQRARVDIYCGHRLQAVADIRSASRQLRESGAKVSPETLAALDQAAWLTRRRQHVLAEQSLEAVLNRIAAIDARA